ncbi:MAG TPA: chromosomal replication initiator protein DnaA [Candidatus Saccharimonadales bacterium]|nr:chromosomal replication initiator protein DnaA [Candidatus Saccharimonadales bacterium]
MQTTNLWQAVLGEIELTISRGNFVTWFKNTQLLQNSEESVIIGVPNVFIKQQLEKKYNDLIVATLQKNGINSVQVEYKIYQPPRGQQQPVPDITTDEAGRPTLQNPKDDNLAIIERARQPNPLTHTYRPDLNEKYVFETFVVGSGSELAYAACQAIAAQPGTKYNPLFLYGGVGIGKTHLIQAVGNTLKAKKPSTQIVYASTEQFVQEFVDALRLKKTTDFAKRYRSADVLIVDDIQFIAGKEKIQEEFFHTFNVLHQNNRQIIISSDKPPRDIPTLEERLRTRLAMGMMIDMQTPDFETRCAIIQTKATAHEVPLPSDVVEFLANLVQTNIRELEGALNQLLAFCEMRGLSPDLPIATSLLGVIKSRPKHLSARQVIERTARYYQISVEDILGPKRDKDIVVPRQVAMYMLRNELHLSFPKIARELGRKDHTTAIHSVEKIERESHIDNDIREAIKEIQERLYV